jgi:hypothetical protein
VIPVLLALSAAVAFAVATVVQHRAAAEAGGASGLRFLRRLLRRPRWLAAQAIGGLGVVLHAGALRSGSVVLVQPLLAGGLVLSLALGAVVDRRHPGRPLPDRSQWGAAVAVAVGLGMFVLAARPAAGRSAAAPASMATCAGAALVVAVAVAVWARDAARPHRALVLGIAGGTSFGVTGLLLKQVLSVPLISWSAAATAAELAVVAGCGIVLTQRAYQAGSLIESLPVTTVLEPAVGVLLAGPLFGEWLAPGLALHAGQFAGVALLVGGLAVLARRSALAGTPVRPESATPVGSRGVSNRRSEDAWTN